MSMNPPTDRLSYAVPLGQITPAIYKFNDLGNTAVFEYGYPIAWLLQCFYFGYTALFANTGQVKAWFKASGASSVDQWFYTAFGYSAANTLGNPQNQSIVSYTGTTYKVYGKKIQCFFEMLSDLESAKIVVVAVPQVAHNVGAMVEQSEQDYLLSAATLFPIPQYATHFSVIGQLVDGVELYSKAGLAVVASFSALSAGQYIKIPFDAVYFKCASEIRISLKFYGVL